MIEKSQYMEFVAVPTITKTKNWRVYDRRGGVLGDIRWFGRWRQYTFFPFVGTVFSAGCMEDLSAFLKSHKDDRNG